MRRRHVSDKPAVTSSRSCRNCQRKEERKASDGTIFHLSRENPQESSLSTPSISANNQSLLIDRDSSQMAMSSEQARFYNVVATHLLRIPGNRKPDSLCAVLIQILQRYREQSSTRPRFKGIPSSYTTEMWIMKEFHVQCMGRRLFGRVSRLFM